MLVGERPQHAPQHLDDAQQFLGRVVQDQAASRPEPVGRGDDGGHAAHVDEGQLGQLQPQVALGGGDLPVERLGQQRAGAQVDRADQPQPFART